MRPHTLPVLPPESSHAAIQQQNEMIAANENISLPPAAFWARLNQSGGGLLVHLTLFLAKESQSQTLQHT